MSATPLLLELAKQVRGHTIELLQATPQGWLTWAPPHTSNHILWHAGHAVWLQDELCVRRITGHSELPSGWADRFGMRSQPATGGNWPRQAEVEERLAVQLDRMLTLIEQLPPERMRIPEPPPERGWDLVRGIIHGLHDEARHHGEMYLLFKLCRRGQHQGV